MEHHHTHDHSHHSAHSSSESKEHESHHDHASHDGHDKHAGHNIADFRERFIISTLGTLPVLALSDMIQQWFGFELSFPGDKYVLAVLSTFIFVYGGYPFLKGFCEARKLSCPRPRTIGRIIADQPDKMRSRAVRLGPKGQTIQRKKPLKGRKPKGYKASAPGQCGAFDTVEYFLDGIRRYVITFTDHYSRFAFAWATQSHASWAAREFFEIVAEVFPYPLQSVLTDNGSEFMKHFDEELRRLHKNHWHTYPKTPKMNAHVERFNRTIQEEFIDYHQDLLLDPDQFNRRLIPWLLWYNAERPHWALKLDSPVQFLLKQNPALCNSWWPNTVN